MTRAKADEYRRRAQECLAAVRMVSTEAARASLMAIAAAWERLADQPNHGTDLSAEAAPSNEQPAAQQQQQIQPGDDKKENKKE